MYSELMLCPSPSPWANSIGLSILRNVTTSLKNRLLRNVSHPTSVVSHGHYNISWLKPSDLHIFLNDDNFDQNIHIHLSHTYNQRETSNKEIWMVDISGFDSIENTKTAFQNLKLGLLLCFDSIDINSLHCNSHFENSQFGK